jgi:hypothetical protein
MIAFKFIAKDTKPHRFYRAATPQVDLTIRYELDFSTVATPLCYPHYSCTHRPHRRPS